LLQFVSVACVTASDYFNDLQANLDPFFFERAACMVLIHIGAVTTRWMLSSSARPPLASCTCAADLHHSVGCSAAHFRSLF
jgi:hypothetical protein